MFVPTPEMLAHLRGAQFSSSYRLRLGPRESREQTRLDVLRRWVSGKRVVHVGFADHLELIAEKRRTGRWLHDWLAQWTQSLAGIDINAESVSFVSNLGVPNVFVSDITREIPATIAASSWDVVLLGEVVEHVDDPVGFLRAVRERWTDHQTQLIVTVPNAFAACNIELAMQNLECINSDHRYWFSPFTISKILMRAGWDVEEVELCQFDRGPSGVRRYDPRSLMVRVAVDHVPLLRDTVAVKARRSK